MCTISKSTFVQTSTRTRTRTRTRTCTCTHSCINIIYLLDWCRNFSKLGVRVQLHVQRTVLYAYILKSTRSAN